MYDSATISNLTDLVEHLSEGSTWQMVKVGKFNLRMTTIVMCMGGNIRTGLEDTLYYQNVCQ